MSNLTQKIKEEFQEVGQTLRGIVRGAVQGIYTPALINTGVRQFANELTRDDKSDVEIIAKDTVQVLSAGGIHTALAVYAIEQGRGLEYFGALALTNIVDYLVHRYKHSKK